MYSKNGDLTTRADMADNQYSRVDPYSADLSRAIPVSRTPFTLKFFELINSPQGPWLQMLQRVYYTNDDLEQIWPSRMSDSHRLQLSGTLEAQSVARAGYLAPALLFVASFRLPVPPWCGCLFYDCTLLRHRFVGGGVKYVQPSRTASSDLAEVHLKYTLILTPI